MFCPRIQAWFVQYCVLILIQAYLFSFCSEVSAAVHPQHLCSYNANVCFRAYRVTHLISVYGSHNTKRHFSYID